jgi:hypothetical protein
MNQTEAVGKVFMVEGNMRRCLICERIFTPREAAAHVRAVCRPSAGDCAVTCSEPPSDPNTATCLPPPVDGNLLQVMPWPVLHNMTDHQIEAIYEYLGAIRCIDNTTSPPPRGAPNELRNDCGDNQAVGAVNASETPDRTRR